MPTEVIRSLTLIIMVGLEWAWSQLCWLRTISLRWAHLSFMQTLGKLGLAKTFHELPSEIQGMFKRCRVGGIRIEVSTGDCMRKIIEAVREDFRTMLHTETQEIPDTGQRFSIREILVELHTWLLCAIQFYDIVNARPVGGQWTAATRT